MSATDIVDTGIALPRIAEVRSLPPFSVVVSWAEGRKAGRSEIVDLAPVIKTYKIFRPLRDNERLFKTVHVADDGDVIAWDGENLELPAETIELLAEQTMTPEDFVAFMKRNGLTQAAVAAILGYSRRQIGYFTTTGPIPRVVALACKGYEIEQEKSRFGASENGRPSRSKANTA